ncbi:hypothetical protein KY289_002701 [Solanum tuberosum]|nr:hypothetical protein KY289_002701 [Solanum tuberosum]
MKRWWAGGGFLEFVRSSGVAVVFLFVGLRWRLLFGGGLVETRAFSGGFGSEKKGKMGSVSS